MRENKRCQNVEKALSQVHEARRPVEPPPGWSTDVMRTARLAAEPNGSFESSAQSLFYRLSLNFAVFALVIGVAMWGYMEAFGPDLEYKLVQNTLMAKGNFLSWGMAL